MRIRQIALVAHELEGAVDDLCSILGLDVCHRDPGVAVFGLENALMAVGDTFLEVVSPSKPDTTAGRLLDRRGGDGGYMVILQIDDLASARARAEAHGVRVVWETALEDIATIHLHPRDVGAAIVSLDEPHPPASWRWAGSEWETMAPSACSAKISGVDLQSDRPDVLAARWAEVLGRPIDRVEDERITIELDDGRIGFVRDRDGRGEGIAAVEIEASDPGRILASAQQRGAATTHNPDTGDTEIAIVGTTFRLR